MTDYSTSSTAQFNKTRFHAALTEHFDESELRTLCFDLGIDYEDLSPGGRSDKARSLIERCRRERRLPELVTAVLDARPQISPHQLIRDEDKNKSPFKGLYVFEEKDADIFFGRESLVKELVQQVVASSIEHEERPTFLPIVGPSGSGKSSVVRAGLIPAIRAQTDWAIHIITPTAKPLEALAISLTRDSESVTATDTLIDDLGKSPRALHLYLRKLLEKEKGGTHTGETRQLLVVDQFEELFTLCRSDEKKRAFVDNLITAVDPKTASLTTIVIVLRADFYGHCWRYKSLYDLLPLQHNVPMMSQEELCEAIEYPARKASLVYEEGLVDLLLRDVGDEPGNLPLLSHVLLETWQRREGNRLTLAGYIDAGGVHGAIAKTAESTYRSLSPEQQFIARHIFLRLTEFGEGSQYTRREATFAELIPQNDAQDDVEAVLKILVGARLVTTDKESIEVAHEALIRKWSTLQNWLEEDRTRLRLLRNLREAANNWQLSNRNNSYLYSDSQLNDALDILPSDIVRTRYSRFLHPFKSKNIKNSNSISTTKLSSQDTLIWGRYIDLEREFLTKSLEANEKRLIKKRLAWTGVFLSIFLLLFVWRSLSTINWYSGKWSDFNEFYGNEITALLISNNSSEIFAGININAIDHSKILRSKNDGESWLDFDQGLPELPITSIVKIPDKEEQFYVSTYGAGVFSYDHKKNTWNPINDGLFNFAVNDIAYNIENPNILWLATYGRYGGIYISHNAGTTWSTSNNGLTSENILKIVTDSLDPNRIYAISEAKGMFKSEDSGETWLEFNSPSDNIVSLLVHPKDNTHLYVATLRNGAFRSIDSGNTWQSINSGLPNIFDSQLMVFSQNNPEHIYLVINIYGGDRLFISKDGGDNWGSIPGNWTGVKVTDLGDSLTTSVFLGSEAGLYKLSQQDKGYIERLSPIKFKLPGTSLAINADNSHLFFAVKGGVFRYQYDIDEWVFLDHGFTHPSIRTLAADPKEASRIYAGMFSDGASDVLFVTNDRGESWTALGTFRNGLENDDIRSIVIDPKKTNEIYVGTYGSGIFKSYDYGANWSPINAGITKFGIIKLVINQLDPQNIYAIAEGGSVYQTTDGGELWQELPETKDLDIRDLEIMPANQHPCIAVFGTNQGNIRCWTGENWKFLENGLDSRFVTQLEINESDTVTMFAGTKDNGVYWSRNNGEDWSPINEGLGISSIEFLLANPREKDAIYALVQEQGLFYFEPSYIWQQD